MKRILVIMVLNLIIPTCSAEIDNDTAQLQEEKLDAEIGRLIRARHQVRLKLGEHDIRIIHHDDNSFNVDCANPHKITWHIDIAGKELRKSICHCLNDKNESEQLSPEETQDIQKLITDYHTKHRTLIIKEQELDTLHTKQS